jgi:hypothetical protein
MATLSQCRPVRTGHTHRGVAPCECSTAHSPSARAAASGDRPGSLGGPPRRPRRRGDPCPSRVGSGPQSRRRPRLSATALNSPFSCQAFSHRVRGSPPGVGADTASGPPIVVPAAAPRFPEMSSVDDALAPTVADAPHAAQGCDSGATGVSSPPLTDSLHPECPAPHSGTDIPLRFRTVPWGTPPQIARPP